MTRSLYERLGGTEGITKIAADLVDIHLANPRISPRYANSSTEKVKHGAATFFIADTGGPNVYEGEDMVNTHRGMNINEEEFLAVLDDALRPVIRTIYTHARMCQNVCHRQELPGFSSRRSSRPFFVFCHQPATSFVVPESNLKRSLV